MFLDKDFDFCANLPRLSISLKTSCCFYIFVSEVHCFTMTSNGASKYFIVVFYFHTLLYRNSVVQRSMKQKCKQPVASTETT